MKQGRLIEHCIRRFCNRGCDRGEISHSAHITKRAAKLLRGKGCLLRRSLNGVQFIQDYLG